MEFIDPLLLRYCENHSSQEPDLLRQLNRDTHASVLMPRMLSGHLQGRFLSMISKMLQPSAILEIGTYTGYSALCLCEGLADGGELISIDINDELEDFTMSFIRRSAYASSIRLFSGDACEIIPGLDATFDLVFIDADKSQYAAYFDLVFDKVRSGGVILADNVLWSGQIMKEEQDMDADTMALHQFNQKVNADSRVEVVMLPIRDGISLIRKR